MTGLAITVARGPRATDQGRALVASTAAILTRLVGPADDAPRIWSTPRVALGQSWWATTPEDVVRGSAVAERGPLRLIADARVDNREEMAEALGLSSPLHDPELLLACWEAWGDSCLERIAGDYAFAVWDQRDESLVMARDPFGARPLYVAVRDEVVLAASELHALGAGPWGVELELDQLQSALFLLDRHAESAATLYVGVEVVPPGGILRVSGQHVTRKPVWRPDPFAPPPAADAAGCAEHLRELLERAVRARLRRVGDLAVLTSGGLDSSTVACVAAREEPSRAHEMLLLHAAYPGLPCDEAGYFEPVVKATGARPIVVAPKDHAALTSPDTARAAPGESYDVSTAMLFPLFEPLDRSRKTVVLTGAGGDDIMYETDCELRDHLRAGRWRDAFASTRRGAARTGSFLRFIAPELSQLLIRGRARAVLRHIRPAKWAWPEWLTPDAMQLVEAWHREQMATYEALAAPTESQRRIALRLSGGTDLHTYTSKLDLIGRRFAVDVRHPFYDRRVVEALLAIPHEQRFDGELTKCVLRRAMTGILPEKVRRRAVPTDFQPFVVERMRTAHRALHESMLRDPVVARIGVVRSGSLEAMLGRVEEECRTIMRAMAIEVSFRTIRAAHATEPGRTTAPVVSEA